MAFSNIEQEAIVLNAIWDMIDDMVNYSMFVKAEKILDTNLMFNTNVHGRLFNILLGDFLSQPAPRNNQPLPFDLPVPPSGVSASNLTYLYYLRGICSDPKFNDDVSGLRKYVEGFSSWLEEETFIEDVWLPSIETQISIRVPRIEFLKICADIGKHNFVRLQRNVRRIQRVLAANGKDISENEGYLVLPEFWDWFHTHLFVYHSSAIAEFLNNIRYEIYGYLSPEYSRSHELVDPEPMYKFNYPTGISEPLARTNYWDLMNRVRSGMWFPRFTISSSFKSRY